MSYETRIFLVYHKHADACDFYIALSLSFALLARNLHWCIFSEGWAPLASPLYPTVCLNPSAPCAWGFLSRHAIVKEQSQQHLSARTTPHCALPFLNPFGHPGLKCILCSFVSLLCFFLPQCFGSAPGWSLPWAVISKTGLPCCPLTPDYFVDTSFGNVGSMEMAGVHIS